MLIRLMAATLIAFPFLTQLPLLFLYIANDGKSVQNIVWWAHYTSAIGVLFVIIPIMMALVIIIGLLKLLSLLILFLSGWDFFNLITPE